MPLTVTVPAVDKAATSPAPATAAAVSVTSYVVVPLFEAASIVVASDTVASVDAVMFTASLRPPAEPPAIAVAVSDTL